MILLKDPWWKILKKWYKAMIFRLNISFKCWETAGPMLISGSASVPSWKWGAERRGNEEAIANRMLDPSNEDRFDLSNIVPAGGFVQYLRMFLNGVAHRPPQPAQVQASQDVDDIPLDWIELLTEGYKLLRF